MYKIILLLFFTTFLSAKVYDGVGVVVKDQAITTLDIEKMMSMAHVDAKKATDILIRKKLEAIEIKKRNISVSDAEVFADIKQLAERNHLSVGKFYDAVRQSNGLSSSDLKKQIKEKLLSQKLYQAIAMGSVSEPSDNDIKEYFKFHQKEFSHPAAFDVTVYISQDRMALETKVQNPMFYSPAISSREQRLYFNKISPQLASLLMQTKANTFTQIVPNGQGGFMSFYLNSIQMDKNVTLDSVRQQIINSMVAQKRTEVLKDYFSRLRDNSDINIIRMPE